VVVSDVAPYSVVGGNPAKQIRSRFESDVVARLESLAWWDWPIDKITENLELIVSDNVEALLSVE